MGVRMHSARRELHVIAIVDKLIYLFFIEDGNVEQRHNEALLGTSNKAIIDECRQSAKFVFHCVQRYSHCAKYLRKRNIQELMRTFLKN